MSKKPKKGKGGKIPPRPPKWPPTPIQPPKPPLPKRVWLVIWALIGGFSLIITFYTTLPFAYRLSFPTTDLMNKSQPLDGPFVLKNDGWLSLYDLDVTIFADTGSLGAFKWFGGMTINHVWAAKKLKPGDFGTFGMSDRHLIARPMPTDIPMTITVTYRPEWWCFRGTQIFLFHTRMASDGSIRWYPGH